MTADASLSRPLRAALFVDFDNVYIGLRDNAGEEIAECFATEPLRWVEWLERGMPGRDQADTDSLQKRSLLVRRCYLNPRTHAQARHIFTRAAFSVIDCPALTAAGKNSTDIQMAIDMLDALHHEVKYDEFIIFSGDADFTPVLLRLRAHDRRRVILTIGSAAEAYRAAADRVVTEEDLVEHVLEPRPVRFPRFVRELYRASVPEEVLRSIGEELCAEVHTNGALDAPRIVPILKRRAQFANSNWFGFYSLRRLTEKLVAFHPELLLEDGDPWRVLLNPAAPVLTEDGSAEELTEPAREELARAIVARVLALVEAASAPVPLSLLAQQVQRDLGDHVRTSRWAGAGSFRALLTNHPQFTLAIHTPPDTPGYVYDPARHDLSVLANLDTFDELHPAVAGLSRRLYQLVGVPRLSPTEYGAIFETLAEALAEQPFNLYPLSRSVRDKCTERGEAVKRANITWIIRCIQYAGHRFDDPEVNTPGQLAEAYVRNVQTMAQEADMTLSPEESELLGQWIMEHIKPEPPAAVPNGASSAG